MDKNIFAVFQSIPDNKRVALRQTINKGFYIDRLDYDGLFMSEATKDINPITLSFLQDSSVYRCIYSPQSLYHIWHICLCQNCLKNGGRYFDHSQASFNEHLRYINSNDLFTFQTIERIENG